MKHYTFPDNASEYPITILVKDSYFNQNKIYDYYIRHLPDSAIAFDLPFPNNKQTVNGAKQYLNQLAKTLSHLGTKYIYCTDATYFKALTGLTKADPYIGYVMPCRITGLEHCHIVYGVMYGQLLYNPNLYSKLDLSLQTLNNHINGTYKELGDVVELEEYPTEDQVSDLLQRIKQYPLLTCDIETTGLKLGSKIYTIAFGYSATKGCAFKVTDKVKKQLKLFFESYRGTLIFHNATFDTKHIIYNIFMKHSQDYQGMLHGLHTMYFKLHDTKIIAYLATNSTTGNNLSLKDLSHEYTGNYAIDVTDITKHELTDVLKYNLIDTLATHYVYNKYYPKMLQDNQLSIYQALMLPSLKTITQIELCGMPIDLDKVKQARQQLENIRDKNLTIIMNNQSVKHCLKNIKQKELEKINAKLKTKQHDISYLNDYKFNPNSQKHLQELLYEYLQLPIIDYTDSKQPATGSATIEKLIPYANDAQVNLLNALIGLNKVETILSTFIPALEGSTKKQDGYCLHGSFNLGGTISNRLSSSKPNLQNLPSGSEYGKLIKQCFKPNKKWLMVGSDFASLEDRINALLTKDEMKLKVYTDGFDGHCLRAYYYWKDKMPDIDPTSVESINSIKKKYPELRQASKAPTFALTYQGTYQTLMNNCGFTEQEAKQIEANYHKLYKQSDEWLQSKLKLCEQQGYIDVAFGLRIRTPIVGRTVLNTTKTPYMATAEARSVGNALSGQSYCTLTLRAFNAFMEQVWDSEYKYDILPIGTIHDAIYLQVKNDIRVVKYVNDNLIKHMQWQELPEIQHDKVHLESELSIFYPDWSQEHILPNNITEQEIIKICSNT